MNTNISRTSIVLLTGLLLFLLIAAGLGAAATRTVSAQTILYVVDDSCPQVGSGTQLDPYCRIQTAVNAADDGDEIRVAAGYYSDSETVSFLLYGDPYTHTQVVLITKTLTLRGGYSPDTWDTSSPQSNVTTIDANRNGRGITIAGVDDDGPVTIDGFTVTGGDYTGLGNPPGVSNWICSDRGADCGGGIYAYASRLVLCNSVVIDNIASRVKGGGGGIYLYNLGFANDPPTIIENTTVISNSAPGTDYSTGGGLHAMSIYSPISITHSIFQSNTASSNGGGIHLYDIDDPVTVVNTQFINNAAQEGICGGAYFRLTNPGTLVLMDSLSFDGNMAKYRGAALCLHAAGPYSPRAHATNLLFTHNHTLETNADSAVVDVDGSFTSISLDMAHATAADNDAPTFLYAEPEAYEPAMPVTVTLTNTLVSSFANAFAAQDAGDNKVRIRHTNTLLYQVATMHQTVAGAPFFEETNPIYGDPKLGDAYHLLFSSAAIDQGVASSVAWDIDGDPRPHGAAPDIGADEFIPVDLFLPLVVRHP